MTDRDRIIEIAFGSEDVRGYRAEVLAFLERKVGFDLGAFQDMHGTLAQRGHREGEEEEILVHAPRYMSEFTPEEIAAAARRRPMQDLDIFPRARRERLSIYRERLHPHGVSACLTMMWRNRHGPFGMLFARTGPERRFSDQDLDVIERCLPAIQLGDAYLMTREESERRADPKGFSAWADAHALTERERAVAELAARGLQNREIATLLRLSPLTVRNHLASVFRKADVTTRAELAFVSAGGPERAPARFPWMRYLDEQAGR